MTINRINSKIVRIEIIWKQIGSCSFGSQRGMTPYLYVENSISFVNISPEGACPLLYAMISFQQSSMIVLLGCLVIGKLCGILSMEEKAEKMKKSKILSMLCTLCLGIGMFAGCGDNKTVNNEETVLNGSSTEGTETAASDTVIVAMSVSSEPEAGFDPCMNWGSGEHCHEPLIQSTLIRTTVDMEFENDLATDYSVSEDGLTWTFQIRDDAKFTDGEPLSAEDVAFTFQTAMNTKNSETDLSMLSSVEASDSNTVVFHLSKPYNAFLYTLAVFGIVPEHYYEETSYGEQPIGSGRYLLKQWDKGQQVILEANPDYYGDAVQMKRVVVLFMEEDAALAAVKSGQVDIAYTSAVYSEERAEGYHLLACKSVDSRGISLPVIAAGNDVSDGDIVYEAGNNVTSDTAIRQAMNYAVDREVMIKNVLNGYGQVAYSVSDNMPWSSEDMIVSCDKEKAKQILSAGGWADSDGDGIVEKDGQAAEFTIYYPATDSVRQGLTAEFSNQMKEIGIHILYEGLGNWDELYAMMYSAPITWGWGSNSPVENYQLYHTNGASNVTGYTNKKTDELLDAALAATNMEESYQLWQQAQADVAPDAKAPWVWFANVDHLYFVKDKLQVAEQKLHPHGHGWSIVNNVDQWSFQ